MLVDELFEGDLKLSKDKIQKHYNFSSIQGGEEYGDALGIDSGLSPQADSVRDKRAAGSASAIDLWSNNIVPYVISSNIPTSTANVIRRAMDHWEDNTCLRFVARSHSDYIRFDNTDDGCYSNSIGRDGGQQKINLGDRCETFGIIVHEIGHAVGFWHEQSRPDRDSYVRINTDNVKDGKVHNFMKRSDHDIDYQGVGYDYRSIMHYNEYAFSRNNNPTIVQNNNPEYVRQGSPIIGQRNGLSTKDIEQAKRLYSCSGRGVRGALIFQVQRGVSLPDTDPVLNSPDPYVKFTIVDSGGNKHYKQTSVQEGTTSPTWNEWLYVQQLEWQFFRIRVWDDDNFLTFGDDAMSMSQTIVVRPGVHNNIRHCTDTSCSGYVTFDYRFIPVITAKLRVNVRYARSLPDTDPIWNSPDPYVRIEGTRSNGVVDSRNSRVIGGTQSPTWNQWIDFSCQEWVLFNIQVWDDDDFLTFGDDEMSNKETVFVQSGLHQSQRHQAHGSGYLIYDYNIIRDGNECSGSPCRNGGTCRDGCASYTCQCTSGYTGTNCEHFTGNLRFYARYGRDLPDEDGWLNNSDPYMEFIAIDVYGNSVRMTTSTRGGDQSPDWNQWVNFGTRAWRQFKVRVYDDDDNADDALSSQFSWTLSSSQSQSYVRLNCHSGYVYFDYSFN